MKKQLSFIYLLLVTTFSSSAQSWDWVSGGGNTESDIAKYVNCDSSGNSYVVGVFRQQIFAGPNTLISRGGDDVFIAKYDPQGNLIWAKSGGGVADDGYTMISETDVNGNTILATAAIGTVYFDQDTLNNTLNDITILKYDPNGNLLFSKSYGSNSNDVPMGLAIDIKGDFYLTGFFANTAYFGSTSLISSGLTEVYIVKFDKDGNTVWARKAGGSSYDAGTGITTDSKGHVYLTGYFNGNADFSGIVLNSSGGDDVFIACYDSTGIIQWAKSGNSIGAYDIGNKLATDAAGNIYVAGQFSNTIQFDTLSLISQGLQDAFVVKIDSTGNFVWGKSYGGSGVDVAYDIKVLPNGSQYFTGMFTDSATFGFLNLISNGGADIFIAKIFANGSMHWIKQVGGIGEDIGRSIDVLSESDIFLCGSYDDSVTFDNMNMNSAGSTDFFAGRLSAPLSGVFDFKPTHGFSIYPNPVRSGQAISFDFGKIPRDDLTCLVIDNLGRVILKKNLQNSTKSIELPELPEGFYFVKLITGDGNSLTSRFIYLNK